MVSVVIPVLNEAKLAGLALTRLLRQPGSYEVIVVDGGSTDGTQAAVRQHPVRLIEQPPDVPPGLGYQINRGAQQAQGDSLLFLHIDVQLPPTGINLIESALSDPEIVGGGFMPAYDGAASASERLGLAVAQRIWEIWAGTYMFAGDGAPFIRRDVFWHSGGYPPASFACDWDFARQLKRLGRLALIPDRITVANRRLVQNGVVKAMLVTLSVWCLYRLGLDRARLRSWYRWCLASER